MQPEDRDAAYLWDILDSAQTILKNRFNLFHTTRFLPFKLIKDKPIAVKVIDHRGNEVMVVREMKDYGRTSKIR